MKRSSYGLVFLIFLLTGGAIMSCRQGGSDMDSRLERSLAKAGKNKPELEKVLTHYTVAPSDSLKYKAAIFLLANMEELHHYRSKWQEQFDPVFFKAMAGKTVEEVGPFRKSVDSLIGEPNWKSFEEIPDLRTVTSEYLIQNIDQAFEAWRSAPWSGDVSFDAFCNYILPYKNNNEYPEVWRKTLRDRYGHLLTDSVVPKTMTDICCALVDEQRWFDWTDDYGFYPSVFGFSQLMEGRKGSCTEMAHLGAYTARALGIPVAVDYIPQYGNMHGSHVWNALITSDSSYLYFEGAGGTRPGDMFYTREKDFRLAKVFRRHFDLVQGSYAARAMEAGLKDIPELLQNPRIIDVTGGYTQVANLRIHGLGREGEPVFLCIYKWRNWTAVAGDWVKDGQASFPQMGRGLVYMPMYYRLGEYEPAGPPFVLPVHGNIWYPEADEKNRQSVLLKRVDLFKRNWEYNLANQMTGARLEGSADSNFSQPVVLHQIQAPVKIYRGALVNDLDQKGRASYDSTWKTVTLTRPEKFRYVRLIFDEPLLFRLGELEFYDSESGPPLTGIPAGNVPEPSRAFDGFPGKTIKMTEETNRSHWVSLDLGSPKSIRKIRYLPAHDARTVQEGKSYELFYWKGRWESLGSQKCNGLPLEFQEVPSNGLYWLHCRACDDKEERIFTYEDGKQIWW